MQNTFLGHKIPVCLEQWICLIAPLGISRPTRSRMWRSPVCLAGSSLHHCGVQICFGLKRVGNLTQLGSTAYTSLMAPGETGWLWNCCQETQVYQGQIRTHFSLEKKFLKIQILDQRDLRVLPEASPRSCDPASLKVGQMVLTVSTFTNCYLWLNSDLDCQGPFKSKGNWNFILGWCTSNGGLKG